MTDREKIIKSLKNALNSLDYTSDLRLVLIRTIEYLQEEPHKELYDKLSKLTEDALAKETKESWNEFLDNEPVSKDSKEAVLNKAHELAKRAELISGKIPKSTLIVVAIEMAEFGYHQAEKDVIERAAEWLDENLINYWSQAYTDNCNFIEDFKKALENEVV